MDSYSKKIIELRNEGKSYREISEILDCALSTVSYHCKLNKIGGSSDRLTNDVKNSLQELYDIHKSCNKVAKIVGINKCTVLKYIKTDRKKTKSGSESVILWRKKVKEKLFLYKGGKCEKCGYNKCISAMHFHHINPNEKDFGISGKTLSFEKLKIEVDKCMLLCSNCHSEIHEGLLKI